MANIINTSIPDISTSWENYAGDKVEEFLKGQIKNILSKADNLDLKKGSYLALQNVDSATNVATVGIFASQESYSKWKNDPDSNSDLLLSSVDIPMGSGGGSDEVSYSVKLYSVGGNTITATSKSDLVAKMRFVSREYDPSSKAFSDTNESATLRIETKMQGSDTWKTVETTTIQSQSESDTSYAEIDISEYCVTGTQSVRFTATGNITDKKAMMILTVTLASIQVTFSDFWLKPFEYKAASPTIQVPVYVTGSITKILHLKVTSTDGKYSRSYEFNLGTAIYTETTFTADIDHPKAHGVYNIEAWITSGSVVTTKAVSCSIMCTLAGNLTPLLAVNNVGSFQNWSNVHAFDYTMYNPGADTTDILFTLTNLNTDEVIFSEAIENVENGKKSEFYFNLEVETDTNTNFPASMSFTSNGTALRDPLGVVIDNSGNFAPTSGADFYLNPKARNNGENDKATIINAVTGEQVSATFENFSFVSDGWLVDSETNSRCLRVLEGEKLSIDYDAYSDNTASEGLTIELDFATKNVTDEEGILFQMGTASTTDAYMVGLWVKAQESCFMTTTQRSNDTQNWMYRSGKRTHVAVNVVPNLYNQGTNYIRVFINGIISREFTYSDSDRFWQSVNGIKNTGGIVIAPQGADIDIYGLRIYKTSVSATEIRQNYLSAFPTVEEKKTFKDANDILGESGLIDYNKCYNKYNTILYMGNIPSLNNQKGNFVGDVIIHKIGDPAHSGTLYQMTRKGQGSTSKKYWFWNIQSDFKTEDSEGNALNPHWVDENNEDHGMCYQNAEGLPMAKKLVDKRNWASSMQSHKMGATNLYNDLYKLVVGKNEITSIEGNENCRVCVYEEPFLVFQQTDTSANVGEKAEFIGMGTFGSGKADKPTFGYDKTKTPNMLMIEGSDNNPLLTKNQVPWISEDVVYDENDESFAYGDATSWDYDLGNLDTITWFQEAFNFVYLHSNRLKPFKGTYTKLKAASSSLDQSYQYWVTEAESGSAIYDVYRWEDISKAWVPAGITKTNGVYATLNVKTQMKSYLTSAFTTHESSLSYDSMNDDFIEARLSEFISKVETYFNKQDILFFMCMMKLIAGTDNRAKNTYLWTFAPGSPIRAMQDDMDTIIATNNQGQLTKPYYIEEHDFMSDGLSYWNGEDTVLYNLMENAFPAEMKSTMYSILNNMTVLGGGSLDGCWEKYFFSTVRYFPAVAYNEFARFGYEEAKHQKTLGVYKNDTDPLSQSLGSQEEGERQWVKNRNIYISSFAGFGEFDASSPTTGTYQLIRSLQPMDTNITLTTAMWLYPAIGLGQSNPIQGGRCKAGQEVSFNFTSGNDTQYSILGVNHLSDVGKWAGRPAKGDISFSGERLKKLDAGVDDTSKWFFKITTTDVLSLRSVKSIDFHNISTLGSGLDLTKNTRLESLDIRGTKINSVDLPQQEFLKTVMLPSTITTLSLDGQRRLETLTFDSYENLKTLYVNQATCPTIDAKALLETLRSKAQLSEITILGVDWTNVTVDFLTWLLEKQVKITGKIAMAKGESISATLKMKIVASFGNVDDESNSLYMSYDKYPITELSLKGKTHLDKTGSYSYMFNTTPAYGNDITKVSWSMESNDFATINESTGVVTVKKIGSEEDDSKAKITVSLELSDGKTLTAEMTVRFFKYDPQLGDYVFADGTYGNDHTMTDSTPIGVIFYFNEEKTHALAASLQDYNCAYKAWGLYSGDFSGITLASNSSYDCFDLVSLSNITNQKSATKSDYPVNSGNVEANNTLGDFGFDTITAAIWKNFGQYLQKAGLAQGDLVARGMLNTLKIISHRDYILQDANVNKEIPKSSSTTTLAKSLDTCIKAIVSENNTNYAQYYYPAASYCNAYVPGLASGEELDERFGEGRWHLPSTGEMGLYSYYTLQGDDSSVENAVFANALEGLKYIWPVNERYWTSTEYSKEWAWVVNPCSGAFYSYNNGSGNKSSSWSVRPVLAFKL